MAFFNRKKEVVEDVPELERYYAERRTSSIGSWLLALLTMVLTVLVILGLFYGGRWVYRELTKDEPTTTTNPTVNAPQNTDQSGESGPAVLPSGEENNTSTNTQPSPSTNSGTGTSNQGSSSTQSTQGANNQSIANSNLPNSGPGEVITIALAAAAIGYSTKLYLTYKKQSLKS